MLQRSYVFCRHPVPLLHSSEISRPNCFLFQKLLGCIRSNNGVPLDKGSIILILPTGYCWNCLPHLNYSHIYYNYCPNCNNVWKANPQEHKERSSILSCLASYYLGVWIVMWPFFILPQYDPSHYEDDNLCCLKGKTKFSRDHASKF